MTTVTHPTQRPPLPARPRRNEHTGPIRRIIVGSLAAGVVAAAVLTVVVFGGADEYVITGTALLFRWTRCPLSRGCSLFATRWRRAPVNKSDLIAKMTERFSGDCTTAVAAVNGVLEEIEDSVARGERVLLSGFGTFDRRERAPRAARNPRTGEAIRVGASVVPVFRAGTGFKALLTRADDMAMSPGSAAVEAGVSKATGKKSRAAVSGSPAEAVVTAADAAADGRKKGRKKAGKKARDEANEKGKKSVRKAAKGKAGKKPAKGLR